MNPPVELSQWLGITEESILLQDGLLRISDMVEVPPEALKPCDQETKTQQILSLENRNTEDLCVRIEQFCRSESNTFKNLLQYRLNALKGLWKARHKLQLLERENSKNIEDTACNTVKQRKHASNDSATNFSSKLSLLLIFPLIKSQAKVDSSLCNVTTQLLLESLRECPPLSLKEPADCLNGIENLLCSWLGEQEDGTLSETCCQDVETTAAALVTLACARNSIKTVLHTVYLLQNLKYIDQLPVHDIISILRALEGGPSVPATLNASKHIICWSYDDELDKNVLNEDIENNEASKRSMTTDGSFLYVTNLTGNGLSKIGTGLKCTLRSFVYSKNLISDAGFVAFANGCLIHRPFSYDKLENMDKVAAVIDTSTLEQITAIQMVPELQIECPGSVTTINLISNGMEFYWIRSVNTNNENCPIQSQYSHLILLDVFSIDPSSKNINVCCERKVLSKKEESIERLENILRPKRPTRSSSTNGNLETSAQSQTPSNLPSPASSQQQSTTKDVNSTSVGIAYKTLLACPMITCGNYITIITPSTSTTTPANQLARTLFSGGQNSSKSFAACNTFSVKDGYFNSKTDLLDSSGSSLNKGASVSNLSATFDTFNNLIWTASLDYIDQYHNTGYPSPTYTSDRLGINSSCKTLTTKEDNMAAIPEIISTLTEHTGLMCVHYMSNELFSSACNILNGKSADMHHFQRILCLLENSVENADTKTTLCLLVVIQFIMKTSSFEKITESKKDIFSSYKKTLWKIIKSNDNVQEIKRETTEACNAVIAGINYMYGTIQIRNDLLLSLFLAKPEEWGVLHLRELLLRKLSSMIMSGIENSNSHRQVLKKSFNLNITILKKTFEEAREMLEKLVILGEQDFLVFRCSIPNTTETLNYISTLFKAFLSDFFISNENLDEEDRQMFFDLIDELFDGCQEIFENVNDTIQTIRSKFSSEDCLRRISSIQNILKSTVVSHVFLPVTTAMSDSEFLNLEFSQNYISKLVQMSNITCKLSQEINLEKRDSKSSEKSPFYFSSIKIPTPWSAGRVIESCHPLRDNFKFKETIKIPGARFIFLKFDERCSSQYDYDKLILHAGDLLIQYY